MKSTTDPCADPVDEVADGAADTRDSAVSRSLCTAGTCRAYTESAITAARPRTREGHRLEGKAPLREDAEGDPGVAAVGQAQQPSMTGRLS